LWRHCYETNVAKALRNRTNAYIQIKFFNSKNKTAKEFEQYLQLITAATNCAQNSHTHKLLVTTIIKYRPNNRSTMFSSMRTKLK